jgi:non-specific serine/threonine protein kinase/serine/threonine-protein kinase
MATIEWARLKPVFDAVIDSPVDERQKRMDELCQEPDLRRAVESLIVAFEQAGDFLEPQVEAAPETHSLVDRMVGPYRILEEMGEGGMGSVYRAIRADDQYEKEVAIKLVRGGSASGLLLSRFRAERQILARLEHPNIARLLDGGTFEGAPYLVMELVHGEPIDRYCDRLCLNVRQRLELFRTVCSAVQYAHQHLIVHRDIKPSNILVTADGVPKLLDFGIAKLMSSSTGADDTRSMLLALTPEYASPEQARGEEICTASDVYSLGILLYLLLTGRHPYVRKGQSPHEMIRAISECEAPRPSSIILRRDENREENERSPDFASAVREGPVDKLRKRLAGDLDNIVLQALRKEPSRRYGSVEHLSEDIRRHLEGRPVTAREDTLTYRATKFLQRNRAPVIAGLLILLTLVGGMYATWQQSRIAERRFQDIRKMADSDLFEIHDALLKLPASAPLRYQIIARALKNLDKLQNESQGDVHLLSDIAAGYEKVADMQGSFSGPGIGDSGASLKSIAKALEVRANLVKLSRNGFDERKAQNELMQKYSRQLVLTGRTGEALTVVTQALQIASQLSQDRPDDPAALMSEATAHVSLAIVLGGTGSSSSTRQIEDALTHDDRAIAIVTPFVRQGNQPAAERVAIRAAMEKLEHFSKLRRFAEAEKVCHQIENGEFGKNPGDASLRDTLYNRWGILYERAGEQAKALDRYRKTKALGLARLEADRQDVSAQTIVSIATAHIGMQETRLGIPGDGIARLDEAIEQIEKAHSVDPAQSFYSNLLVAGYAYQAEAAVISGNLLAARAKYSQSLMTAEKLAAIDPADLESRLSVAKMHEALGIVAARLGKITEAREEFAAAAKAAEVVLAKRRDDVEVKFVADTTQQQVQAVRECLDGKLCAAARTFRLPDPLN